MKNLINQIVRLENGDGDGACGVLSYNARLNLYSAGGWTFADYNIVEINGVFITLQ